MEKVLVVGEILAELMAAEIGQRFSQPGLFYGPYPASRRSQATLQLAEIT